MPNSILLPEHEAAGARLSGGETRELLTYGDVPAEYRAAQEGAVVFDETTRGRVAVRGADALVFLHRLLANDVRGLADDGAQRGLLLSSKGKVLFDFELVRVPDGALLSLPAERVPALLKALGSSSMDTFLRVENTARVTLTYDDDSGPGLNSQLYFHPSRSGVYRVVATTFNHAVGPFELRIREQ